MQIDQLRQNAFDVVDAVSSHASRVAPDVADRLTSTVQSGAEGIEKGVERARRVVAPAPVRRRRRWPWVALLVVAAGVGFAIVRARRAARAASTEPSRLEVLRDEDASNEVRSG